MGNCKYCGEKTGLLSSAHKECQEAHRVATTSVVALVESGLRSSGPSSSGLRRSVDEIAASGRVKLPELRDLIIGAMATWIDEALSDHVLSEDEEKRLTQFTEIFNIKIEDLDRMDCRKKVKGLILRDLSEGRIPKRFTMSGTLPGRRTSPASRPVGG